MEQKWKVTQQTLIKLIPVTVCVLLYAYGGGRVCVLDWWGQFGSAWINSNGPKRFDQAPYQLSNVCLLLLLFGDCWRWKRGDQSLSETVLSVGKEKVDEVKKI